MGRRGGREYGDMGAGTELWLGISVELGEMGNVKQSGMVLRFLALGAG